jgi:peptidoglycan/xylan/chitin deacetylase (PgdA/CDA1 family)
MTTIRTLMTSAAKATGGVVARRLTGSAPRVLMYHRFSEGPTPRRLEAAAFERHLQYLTKHFHVRPLAAVVAMLREGRPLAPRTVVLTVDDGYADFAEYAYPLLQKYEVPATLFVVTDFLQRNGWLWFDRLHYVLHATSVPQLDVRVHGTRVRCELSSPSRRERAWSAVGELCMRMNAAERARVAEQLEATLEVALPATATADYRAMTWADASRLDPALVDIGSHTCSHPVLSRCTPAEIEHELFESKQAIETRLLRRVQAFAYPHGEPADYDARAVAAAQEAGYACATVAHGEPLGRGADLFRLERLPAVADPTQFRSTVNGLELLANRYRAWRQATS